MAGVRVNAGRLINCTVYSNLFGTCSEGVAAGGVYAAGSGTVENCIISGNKRGTVLSNWMGTPANFIHCATAPTAGLPEGTVDIAASDWSFAMTPSAPSPFSPVSNAGSIAGEADDCGAVDFFGHPRIANSTIDIGHEEVAIDGLICDYVTATNGAYLPFAGTLTSSIRGDTGGATYYWDVTGDGQTDLSGVSATSADFSFVVAGDYTITLSVTNGVGDGVSVSHVFHAWPREQYYVNRSCANPVAPYSTWETAATNIQNAVDAAEEGGIIHIAASATAYAPFSVTKEMIVRGETGNPNDVVVDGQNKVRCILVNNKLTVISGLTATRGLISTGTKYGAGIYLSNGGMVTNCIVRDCNTTGNTSSENVYGGICNNNGIVVDTVIRGCKSYNKNYGVGYYQTGDAALGERLTITNNVAGNQTHVSKGALDLEGGVVRNSLIAGNKQPANGIASIIVTGVMVNKGALVNCTVCGNLMSSDISEKYAGVYVGVSGQAVNCIIVENGSSVNASVNNWSGTAANYVNCATTPLTGLPDGNVDFVNYLWTCSAAERVLDASTTLVDAGVATSLAGTVDFFRQPRQRGAKPDIGHEEFQPGALEAPFASDNGYTGIGSLSANLTATPQGATEGVVYYWDLDGDGAAETFGAGKDTVALSLTTPGDFTLTLWATNAVGNGTKSSRRFQVYVKTQYVKVGAENPIPPYATPATAAADLPSALNVALDGGEIIILTNGVGPVTLQLTGMVTIDKEVTVRGSSGKFSDVVIRGGGAAGVVNITDPGAVLSSVTICNGAGTGGGVRLDGGGMVTNCRITASSSSGGTGIGIYNDGGLVVDSVIDGCTCGFGGGYSFPQTYTGLGLYQTGSAALTDRCVVTNNSATFISNSAAPGAAVVIAGGAIRNSYVADNDAGVIVGRSATPIASGLYVSGTATADNCTVYRNRFQGFGEYLSGLALVGSATARNCLALENGNGVDTIHDWSGAASSFTNLLSTAVNGIEGGVEASGEALVLIGGRPVLPLGSAARDAGAAIDWMDAAALDVNRIDRVDGSAPDLGCVEIQASAFAASFTATQQKGVESFDTVITPSVAGSLAGAATAFAFEWKISGNGMDTTVPTQGLDPIPLTLDAAGQYYGDATVTMTAYAMNGATPIASATFSRVFTLAPAKVYAANGNAGAAYPYATPGTAAANIQTALNTARDGTEVVVLASATSYNQGATIFVDHAVDMHGETGDFKDVVLSGGRARRVLQIRNKDAIVRDMTINGGAGGSAANFGGMGVRMRGGTLKNCRVTNSGDGIDGLIAGGVWCDNGALLDCVMDRNYGVNHTMGISFYLIGASGLADRCIVTNHTFSFYGGWSSHRTGVAAVFDGTVRNTLVAYNSGSGSALGATVPVGLFASDALVENCSVVTNTRSNLTDAYTTAGLAAIGSTRVVNTLIHGNSYLGAVDNYKFASGVTLSHLATEPVDGLDGVKHLVPTPADYAMPRGGRMTLPRASRLISAGEDAAWTLDALDLYGQKRKVGRHVDIGCVESQFLPATMLLLR